MKDANPKEVFKECGTCSRTFAHLLNRAYNHPKENEERAMAPLAGGIYNHGYQCGMLWGSALAIGAEAYRRFEDQDTAMIATVHATRHIMESFVNKSSSINCRDIIGINLQSIFGMAKFLLRTTWEGMENSICFDLADEWASDAIAAGNNGLSDPPPNDIYKPLSCASEVVKRMNGTDKEMAMVAGFAGGLGLSGNGCGALSAAIWMKHLTWCRENPGKMPPMFNNSIANKILKAFKKETNSEMLCSKITGKEFSSLNDHSVYIRNKGCDKLLAVLSLD